MVSPCYLLLLQTKRGDRKTGSGRDQSKEGKSEIHHASNDERHADHDPDQQRMAMGFHGVFCGLRCTSR
jgi:hypothetical protein